MMNFRKLDIYKLALGLIRKLRRVQETVQKYDGNLANQLKRASVSIPLNIAESCKRRGRDQGHLLSVAMGSAAEVQAILDVSAALELIDDETAAELNEMLDRICAMAHRLRTRG